MAIKHDAMQVRFSTDSENNFEKIKTNYQNAQKQLYTLMQTELDSYLPEEIKKQFIEDANKGITDFSSDFRYNTRSWGQTNRVESTLILNTPEEKIEAEKRKTQGNGTEQKNELPRLDAKGYFKLYAKNFLDIFQNLAKSVSQKNEAELPSKNLSLGQKLLRPFKKIGNFFSVLFKGYYPVDSWIANKDINESEKARLILEETQRNIDKSSLQRSEKKALKGKIETFKTINRNIEMMATQDFLEEAIRSKRDEIETEAKKVNLISKDGFAIDNKFCENLNRNQIQTTTDALAVHRESTSHRKTFEKAIKEKQQQQQEQQQQQQEQQKEQIPGQKNEFESLERLTAEFDVLVKRYTDHCYNTPTKLSGWEKFFEATKIVSLPTAVISGGISVVTGIAAAVPNPLSIPLGVVSGISGKVAFSGLSPIFLAIINSFRNIFYGRMPIPEANLLTGVFTIAPTVIFAFMHYAIPAILSSQQHNIIGLTGKTRFIPDAKFLANGLEAESFNVVTSNANGVFSAETAQSIIKTNETANTATQIKNHSKLKPNQQGNLITTGAYLKSDEASLADTSASKPGKNETFTDSSSEQSSLTSSESIGANMSSNNQVSTQPNKPVLENGAQLVTYFYNLLSYKSNRLYQEDSHKTIPNKNKKSTQAENQQSSIEKVSGKKYSNFYAIVTKTISTQPNEKNSEIQPQTEQISSSQAFKMIGSRHQKIVSTSVGFSRHFEKSTTRRQIAAQLKELEKLSADATSKRVTCLNTLYNLLNEYGLKANGKHTPLGKLKIRVLKEINALSIEVLGDRFPDLEKIIETAPLKGNNSENKNEPVDISETINSICKELQIHFQNNTRMVMFSR